MVAKRRTVAVVVWGVGFLLLAVVPSILESRITTGVHLVLGGAAVLFLSSGKIWWESELHTGGEYDERQMSIRYRSGWLSFWVLAWVIWGLWSVQNFSTWQASADVFLVLGLGALGLQGVGHVILKRRM